MYTKSLKNKIKCPWVYGMQLIIHLYASLSGFLRALLGRVSCGVSGDSRVGCGGTWLGGGGSRPEILYGFDMPTISL